MYYMAAIRYKAAQGALKAGQDFGGSLAGLYL